MATTVTTTVVGGTRVGVVALTGDIDIAVQERVRKRIAALLDRPLQAVVVDLTRLTFTDATGINALVLISRRAGERGLPVALAGSTDMVERLLHLLDLYDRFQHEPTLDAAVAAVGDRARSSGCPSHRPSRAPSEPDRRR